MSPLFTRRNVLGTSLATFTLPGLAWAQASGATTPASARPAVAAYAQTPKVDHIALSPDGKRGAVVTQDGDDKFLLYFDIGAQQSRRIPLGPAKVRNLIWGSNTHVILTTSTTANLLVYGRHEFFLGRSINLETGKVRSFFGHDEYFQDIVLGEINRIKVSGKYRVTAVNRRLTNGFELCVFSFDPDSERGERLIQGSRVSQDFVVLPDGRPMAYADFEDGRKEWILYFNKGLSTGRVDFQPIYSQQGETINYPDLLGLGRDGNSVLIRVYVGEDEDRVGYREISADGTVSPPIDPEGEDKARSPLFHPTTDRFAGFRYHGDWFTDAWTDPLMKKLYDALPKTLGEGVRFRVESYAEDPRKMIVYTEDAQDAGSYFFCDFTTGAVAQLAVNYPDLPTEWITQKQAVSYKAADRLEIQGYLTLPPFKEGKNLPLIALPHGGPYARDHINFDWQAQVLAAYGYAVLQPNFRGSSGYGRDFAEAGNGEFGRKMQTDIYDGVRHLAAKGVIDPKRVAIMGASYGGYAALAGATLDDPGIYRCAVSIAGVSDPESLVEDLDGRPEKVWKIRLGNRRNYDDISPRKQAARAYCPILLMHGSDDTVVPISQSRDMEKALKAAGKPVEFIIYKGQDHWETRGTARVAMMEAALSFLQKHNPA